MGYGADGPYADFARKAAGLMIPVSAAVPNRPDLAGYHPEYSGFPKDPQNPRVKQADTILLSFPLDTDPDPVLTANDLSFYDGITDPNGPAMTWAMFAVGWMDVGNFSAAASHFRRGFANVQVGGRK